MNHIPQELRKHILSYLPFRPKNKDELVYALNDALNWRLQKRQLSREKYGDIETWDTSCITDMSDLFLPYNDFNRDISKWNVSNVKNFRNMFRNCRKFNINISNWNVENGEDFSHMFHGAKKFKQNLSIWKPCNAKNMNYMFASSNMIYDIDKWQSYVNMNIPMNMIFYNAGLRRRLYQ